MAVRFENLVTETYKNDDGSEHSLQINTTLLLNIYYEPGTRSNKDARRNIVAHRMFKNKHPRLSKFYNPYEIHEYRTSEWYSPRVVFNYGRNGTSLSFSNKSFAEEFYAAMTKKYFGK